MRGSTRRLLFAVLIAVAAVSTGQSAPAVPIPGRLVVTFSEIPFWTTVTGRDGLRTGDPSLDHVLQDAGAISFRPEFGRRSPHLYLLKFDPEKEHRRIIEELESLPQVERAEADLAVPLLGYSLLPDDPLATAQWHLAAINSHRGWAVSRGGEQVVVGIIDSGVDYNHPDLVPAMWINEAEDINGDGRFDLYDYDGVDNDGNGYVDDVVGYDWVDTPRQEVYDGEDPGPPDNDPSDFNGHGTHCAGTACAVSNNGEGVASPGYDCRIAALRAGWMQGNGMGVVGLSYAASAINYAIDMEFDVLSMSFGSDAGNPHFFREVLHDAAQAGIILVGAAGNDSWDRINYPAAEDCVIAVAASARDGGLADFSNFGDWVTISAPGEFVRSTMIGGHYGPMSGTSMSAPVLAGVAAQLKALKPGWGYFEVTERLTATASPMNDEGAGAGLVDFAAAVDMFVSVDSLWTANSDGGNRLKFDEQGTLGLRWWKRDGVCSNVTMEIETDDPRITIGEDQLVIGDVLAGDYGGFETSIEIAAGEESNGWFTVDAIFSGMDSTGEEFTYRQPLGFRAGRAEMLLINADPGEKGRTDRWYLGAFDSLDYDVESLRREEMIDLAGTLAEYEVVFTTTGELETGHFPDDQLDIYADWVESGGRWVVSGQNIAQDLHASNPGRLEELFGVSFVAEHAERLTVRGIEGNRLTGGMYLVLVGSGGARNQNSVDVIAAGEECEPLFVYDPDRPDRLAGGRREYGEGEIIYCAFGIEGINDSMNTADSRMELIERIMQHWGYSNIPTDRRQNLAPSGFETGAPWPNPTNGAFSIPVRVPSATPLRIKLFDMLGRVVAGWEIPVRQGVNRFSIQFPDRQASGTYILRMQNGDATRVARIILLK